MLDLEQIDEPTLALISGAREQLEVGQYVDLRLLGLCDRIADTSESR